MLILALATGTSWLIASPIRGASTASTEIDGRIQSLDVRLPEPSCSRPGTVPIVSRISLSVRSSGGESAVSNPSTATSPSSVCSVDSRRARAVTASGKMPPYMPECTAFSAVLTSTTHDTSPRSDVVRAGWPTRQLPDLRSRSRRRRAGRRGCRGTSATCAEPISSSPSMKIFRFTGGVPPKARSVPRCMITPDLSSEAPRPNRRPSLSNGSNGADSHASAGPGGWTSWWA